MFETHSQKNLKCRPKLSLIKSCRTVNGVDGNQFQQNNGVNLKKNEKAVWKAPSPLCVALLRRSLTPAPQFPSPFFCQVAHCQPSILDHWVKVTPVGHQSGFIPCCTTNLVSECVFSFSLGSKHIICAYMINVFILLKFLFQIKM